MTLIVSWNWMYYVATTVGILVYLIVGLVVATLLLRFDRTMPTEVGFVAAHAWPLVLLVLVFCVIVWALDRLLRRLAGRKEGDV